MEAFAQIMPLAVLFVIFYFLVIRPQQQQVKKHKEMVSLLKKGDKIITSGGIYGEVMSTEEDFIRVRLNDEGTIVKVAREFVAKKADEN